MTKSTKTIFNSSILATLGGAAVIVAAVAAGGNIASFDTPVGTKGDRFANAGAELCSTQSWPNISAECVAWQNNDPTKNVRYITLTSVDNDAHATTLTRVVSE